MQMALARVACTLALVSLAPAAVVRGQEPGAGPPGKWVLETTFGAGAGGGGYGEFLEKPINFDFNISKGTGPWRFGGGIQFGSMLMKPPYEDQKDWARFDTYVFARRVFNHGSGFRPYLEGRVGLARTHPRGELLYFDEPENLPSGASPTRFANGVSFTLRPGVELRLNDTLSLDLSAWWTGYKTSDFFLREEVNGPPDPPLADSDTVSSGYEYGLRAGLAWRPLARGVPPLPPPMPDPSTGTLRPLPPADDQRDEWGVPRSWGWATAQMLAINLVASMSNEYTRNQNFTQISPRSWRDNLETGYTWDDNTFHGNQLVHPWNGSAYFNSARTNGIGFWGSAAMAIVGSYVWECCGETHPKSWNDMVSTGLGGIARGEWAYRLGNAILDNTKKKGRVWREIAAFPVNPIGQFNRVVSGRATRVQGNPESPYDWRPPLLGIQFMTGARAIGEGSSITENTKGYGFVAADVQYGSPFFNERRRPFDRFDTTMQLNIGDVDIRKVVGELTIRGDLASWPLGEDKNAPRHVVAIIQDFDYIANEAYLFGGQSFGVALFSGYGDLAGTRLVTRLVGYGTAGAAINADYSFLAEVANRERYREYDYGPGVGFGAEALLTRKGRPVLDVRYRYSYIDVKNGSLWNPDLDDDGELYGSSASHQVHRFRARLNLPVTRTLAIGAEGSIFYRDSKYSLDKLQDRTQRNPEARLFLTWDWDVGHTPVKLPQPAGE